MQLFTDQTIQAIYRTLLDSLWLGLLLAIVSGITILVTKKSSSAMRYNFLLVYLFLYLGSICFSFSLHWRSTEGNSTRQVYVSSSSLKAGDISSLHLGNLRVSAKEKKFVGRFVNYLNANASLLVTIWFFVLCALCIKLLGNIGYMQRIRYHRTHGPSEYWEMKIQELAERLQIRKGVQLLESEIVRIPMVIGLLKPVILFPFSLLSHLPSQQVEAILLHELAHIKRDDYFVNLIQSFAEILFFFNPAVLWVSSMIREERENCCDDMVVVETKSRNELIYALVSFQEYNLSSSKYLTAFPGRRNYLLDRIKRILTNSNKTLNHMEKISLVTGIVIASLVLIGFSQKRNMHPVTGPLQIKNPITDTIPQKERATEEESSARGQYIINGKKYEIIQKDGQVVGLYIDGQKVPEEEMSKYRTLIEKIKKDNKENKVKMKIVQMKLQKEEEWLKQRQEELSSQMAQLNEQIAKNQGMRLDLQLSQEPHEIQQQELNLKLDLLKKEQDSKAEEQERMWLASKLSQMGNDMEKKARIEAMIAAKAYQQQLENRMALLNNNLDLLGNIKTDSLPGQFNINGFDLDKQKELLELRENLIRIKQQELQFQSLHMDPDIIKLKSQLEILEKQNQNSGLAFVSINPGALTTTVAGLTQSRPIGSIIEDLVNEKIVSKNEDLSFTLNNEILQVNGVQQPPELHKKMKEKYLKGANDHVIYSLSKGSTHADVSLDAK